MKNKFLLLFLLTISYGAMAQDSVMTRNVTVEREFQPVIRQAGKINQRPASLPTMQQQPVEVSYSDYTPSLRSDYNMRSLLSQPTRFGNVDPTHGYLRFGIGHPQTLFDFHYHYGEKNNSVVLKVEHEAEWGLKALEETAIGFDYTHTYSTGKVYFNLLGSNNYYTRYGRHFNDDGMKLMVEKAGELEARDKQNIWQLNANFGVASNGKDPLNYKAEVAYRLYNISNIITEHQANVRLNMDYTIGDHKVGGKIYSQNQMMNPDETLKQRYEKTGKTYNSRHCVRIEPFYEYQGKRVMLHAGVNLDFNIGKGSLLSGTKAGETDPRREVAFAPSPNIRMEAQLAPKWAVLFADVKGTFGTSSMPAYIGLNRYMDLSGSIVSHHVSSYTPVDATVGFIFRPYKTLLVQLHAGYSYNLNQALFATQQDTLPNLMRDFQFLYTDYQRWKFGAQFSFHYRDYVDVHLHGDYYLYKGVKNNTAFTDTLVYHATEGKIYDRPSWQIGLDVVGHIDSHWSVYTNMDFEGGRLALTSYGDRQLKPYINIDLGARYAFGGTGNKHLDRLSLFADLQNLIHRKNMRWYGYESEGIHGRIGLSWRF